MLVLRYVIAACFATGAFVTGKIGVTILSSPILPYDYDPNGFAAQNPFGMLAIAVILSGIALLFALRIKDRLWRWRGLEFASAFIMIGAVGLAISLARHHGIFWP
jgi:hypothetical protein